MLSISPRQFTSIVSDYIGHFTILKTLNSMGQPTYSEEEDS